MKSRFPSHSTKALSTGGERGFALVVVLLLLVAIATLGVMSSSNAFLQTRMARAERDYQLAYAAAESTIVDAELEILTGKREVTVGGVAEEILVPRLGNAFTQLRGYCSSPGNFTASQPGVGLGLYDMSNCGDTWWLAFPFTAQYSQVFGAITGRTLPLNSGSFLQGVAEPPRYVIDVLRDNTPGQSADPTNVRWVFRVTARAVGASPETEVLLQSTVRRL
ncbi:MAG: pilus assembly protein [Burkholderiales bacterium]|nr:pilus assembly protein [Burkholderiales bacterium]